MPENSPQGEENFFLAETKHCPRSAKERYRRIHYYVSTLSVSISEQLKQILLAIRHVSDQIKNDEIRQVAQKPFSEAEFLPAVKELLCIWIHLDAIDQGGHSMSDWLLNYLRLSLFATDFLISRPGAVAVLDLHGKCPDSEALASEVCLKMCEYLGFGPHAKAFAPALHSLILQSRPFRQKILRDSLCLPVDELRA